ncbi:fumarylacetoacetate hydrolase family protein [Nocardia abscessus]|uniref:fumarylacetoacetate hydrolase family protein n=1 Tax=Nocardia TaxID=1817 RepID=UPI001895556B|nr:MULTISPECIES: fumarylacetoacetate hydrolase family protein [Nocardia]MBF6222616.1 fumarylacetoacetate hydrolase family protein [Nocardia abscessus]MDE1672988.1 fumarylacetoacetate hydrolase family protein [Nocardia gipuzkoensis]
MKVGRAGPLLVGLDEQRQRWVDITAVAGNDLIAFLAGGAATAARARELMHAATEAAPTPGGLPFEPTSLRDFSLWEEHMIAGARGLVTSFAPLPVRALVRAFETITRSDFPPLKPKRNFRAEPQFYFGNHRTIVADGSVISWPSYSNALDFELELGVVISRPVRDCSPEQGREAIGGFVVFNDCTARDTQWRDVRGNSLGGMVKAKSFASAISAIAVTADAVIDHWQALTGRVRVNGETFCETSAEGPVHDLGDMVAYAARGETLEAGALLGTGTFPGGCGLESSRFLRRGDVVECEIAEIGSVTVTYGSL